MNTKTYLNISWQQGKHFLELAFGNSFVATEQTGSFETDDAQGVVTRLGVQISYKYSGTDLEITILKNPLSFFFSNSKIFQILDGYASSN